MAAHRFWRLVGFAVAGGGSLELSEARLYADAVLADEGATLSCSFAPESGALSALHDDSATGAVSWPHAAHSSPGFALVWDFGGEAEINGIVLGSGGGAGTFPVALICQYSDDAKAWATSESPVGIVYPGAFELTAAGVAGSASGDPLASAFEPAASSSVVISGDKTTATVNGGGAARGGGYANSGVRQFEVDISGTGLFFVGIAPSTVSLIGSALYYGVVWGVGSDGTTRSQSTGWGGITALPAPCTLGIVVNFDAGTFDVYRNGVFKATVFTDVVGTVSPIFSAMNNDTSVYTLRSHSFSYPVPGATDWAQAYVASPQIFIPIAPDVHFFRAGPQIEIAAGSYPSDGVVSSHLREHTFFDVYHGGLGIIYGTVKEQHAPANTPWHRRVLLIDERSRLTVRETWSDAATGAYEFRGIREGVKYTVLSYDHTGQYGAAVGDNITPEILNVN